MQQQVHFYDKKIFEIGIDKANVELAKKALTRAKTKIPCSCIIEVKGNK